jgi:hypothetical protein
MDKHLHRTTKRKFMGVTKTNIVWRDVKTFEFFKAPTFITIKKNLYQRLNSLEGEKSRFNAPDKTSRM